ncbi:DUF3006 domain-containing protein [Clostridiaceae bacterium M8S5]|nr:DUF3006 domain-containing protein [Clostridiaceae bacterium M8S5]
MKGIIDRFEGKFAVVETYDFKYINIDVSKLPLNTKEGDVIYLSGGVLKIDRIETKKRKQEIAGIMTEIFKK